MTTMITEVYEALVDAGATSDKAIKAAVAVSELENKYDVVSNELKLHRWMLTVLMTGVGSLVWKTFFSG